jgi:CDP-diacylglycerol--glycerol-3-phosphate 3-phosphatidyltransferase
MLANGQNGVGVWKSGVPWALIWFRGAVAPVLMWGAMSADERMALAGLAVAAFLSDWFDGVLARRWNTVTPALRRADTLADTVYFLNVLILALVGSWDVIYPTLPFMAGLLLLESVCQISNFVRFGCRTATHAYLCKVWAVMLCVAATDLFLFHAVRTPMWLSLGWGYVAYLDVLAILWIMPVPAVDVPTAWHAWQRRTALLSPRNS